MRSIRAALLLLFLLSLLALEEGVGEEEVAAPAAAAIVGGGGAIGVGVLCRRAFAPIRVPEPRAEGRGGTAAAAA